MKVKMIHDTTETEDGFLIERFEKGKVYDVSEYVGWKLLDRNYNRLGRRAEIVQESII
jgi:hypothetical protein